MTTEEFKQYLINYFEKKHRYNIAKVFHKEYERQQYAHRSSIESQQQK
jgi:hypothetical protein